MTEETLVINEVSVVLRAVVFGSDCAPLKSFLSPYDGERLDQIQPAVEGGDAFILVAEQERQVIGWAVVHTRFRADLGWYVDADTVRLQSGENAYLEYIEVQADRRGQGIGRILLAGAEQATLQQGKRVLWLHTGEENRGAQQFYQRQGWTHYSTVHPVWRDGAAMRIYSKSIDDLK